MSRPRTLFFYLFLTVVQLATSQEKNQFQIHSHNDYHQSVLKSHNSLVNRDKPKKPLTLEEARELLHSENKDVNKESLEKAREIMNMNIW